MKIVRSYFRPILAQKQMREKRAISLREVSRETDVALSLVTRLANDTIQRVDLSDLARVCVYLDCEVGDLLKLEEMPA
jgi:putative transcriptional regulator